MWNHISNANKKSTEEVYKNIETMYGGEITTFKNNGNQYEMQLSKNGATYHIKVRTNDGKILLMKRTDLVGLKQENLISKKELQQIIKKNYGGKISQIFLNTQKNLPVYHVQLNNQNKSLSLLVDATTGDILSETKVDEIKKSLLLSKKEAEKIAKQKWNGKILNSTYYERSNGGYYLVEIVVKGETKTIQIHAITGKIMSITDN